MNHLEFRKALLDLGLSQKGLAYLIHKLAGRGPDLSTVNRWATGKVEIPGPMVAFLQAWLALSPSTRDYLIDSSHGPYDRPNRIRALTLAIGSRHVVIRD